MIVASFTKCALIYFCAKNMPRLALLLFQDAKNMCIKWSICFVFLSKNYICVYIALFPIFFTTSKHQICNQNLHYILCTRYILKKITMGTKKQNNYDIQYHRKKQKCRWKESTTLNEGTEQTADIPDSIHKLNKTTTVFRPSSGTKQTTSLSTCPIMA